MLPTDRAMHELGKDALLPCTKKVKIGIQVFLYSHMKLDELVCQLTCDKFDPSINNLEIIIGSSHGQGMFCSPIELVYLYADNNEKNSRSMVWPGGLCHGIVRYHPENTCGSY